jgi:hypothetical protein
MSRVKEPSYFAPNFVRRDPGRFLKDKKEYLRLFENARGYIAVGEASPMYLWDPNAPKLIHQTVPHARIIMILRDPIERAYSNYLTIMKYGVNVKKSSFYDELMRDYESRVKLHGRSRLYVELGMYYEQVKRYFDIFGREQVKVIIFEEFVQHTVQTVNEVLAFLGVNHTVRAITEQYHPYSVPRGPLAQWIFSFIYGLTSRNVRLFKIVTTLLPRSLIESLPEKMFFKRKQKPKIDPQSVKFLQEIYLDDVIRLESLLGRSLPWHTVKQQ